MRTTEVKKEEGNERIVEKIVLLSILPCREYPEVCDGGRKEKIQGSRGNIHQIKKNGETLSGT